jgi:hypothetical protein
MGINILGPTFGNKQARFLGRQLEAITDAGLG